MASIYNGIASSERWENLRRRSNGATKTNVGPTERVISGLAGAGLLAMSLRRKRLRPILFPVASGLLSRAITGRCAVKRALVGTESSNPRSRVASVSRGQGIKVEQKVTINRRPVEVYRFWRNLENLPRFMDHLEAVTVIDETRSHWVAKAPAGTKVEWDAVIHNEIEDELIAWRSLPGSEIHNAGSVHFEPMADGTEVRVTLSYEPPAGKLGAVVAKLLGEEPSKQVAEDLRRFKQVMEAGEIPAGSPRRAGKA